MFFIRVITRVYTRICTWFQLRLQFVLDLENKNSKNNKEKTSLNQIKTNKKVSSIQEKFRFFVLPVGMGTSRSDDIRRAQGVGLDDTLNVEVEV